MSGNGNARHKARPVDVTEEEIRELAGSRDKPVAAVARLTTGRAALSAGRLQSDHDAPAEIRSDELAALRRATDRPADILRRLTPSDAPSRPFVERQDERSAVPTQAPPTVSTS